MFFCILTMELLLAILTAVWYNLNNYLCEGGYRNEACKDIKH